MRAEKPREIAARVLQRHAAGLDFLENLLDAALERASLAAPDRGLLRELCSGVVRWQATLDELIRRKAPRPPAEILVTILLRLGLYQLFWLERVPDHAAVNETVDLAKRFRLTAQAGFVNAVLRSCLRERGEIEQTLQRWKTENPSLGYSHPLWLCQRWMQRWQAESLRRLLEWNNLPPPTYARLNALRGSAEQLTRLWTEEKVRFQPREFDWVPAATVFELQEHPPLATLPSFRQGFFYVQDPSTLLAVRELSPQPGETVLDLCAAPGGKSTYAAALIHNRGRIVAQDVDPLRCEMIRQNCSRLGVSCVLVAGPGPVQLPEVAGPFDRALVDVPCSNTGVMRRRVDLRWRISPEAILELTRAQVQLLREAAARVKRGGRLVYSTCSLEPEENQGVVQAFLDEHPSFRLEAQRELMPVRDGVDGAYVARLARA